MAKFKKGQLVWISYPDGFLRVGYIVAQVRKRQLPGNKFRFSKRPSGQGRGHISYVVQVNGKHYWPLVKYIQAA